MKSLDVSLRERTREHVVEYFHRTRSSEMCDMLPGGADTLETALKMFEDSLSANSMSYGRTIYFKEKYIGDIWIYSICMDEVPMQC